MKVWADHSCMAINRPSQILIRSAQPDDQRALARLAILDSTDAPPSGPLLVAELDGELKVALSLRDGSAIADPFTYTAEVVSLLKAHAAAERRRELGRGHRPWRRGRSRRGLVALRA
jgi:hypothetical protein